MIDYSIYAMSRSGHHAFCNWIADNNPSPVVIMLNNANMGWENKVMCSRTSKIDILKNGGGKEYSRIVNIETFDVDYFEKYNILDFNIKHHILFLRDFKNWVASIFQGGGEAKNELTQPFIDQLGNEQTSTIDLWKKQAKMLISQPENIISVLYDNWVSDEKYRERISSLLKIRCSDIPTKMASAGNGSSFTKMNGGVFDSNVLNRHKQLADNMEYMKIIRNNEECVELSREIFDA